ncbi:MAG TPA: iron-containing alcohol dehydrogenase [Roseiflexaceae bacterium]|nr:iron-containing alcohol dehydrogenase [Roseiflexaceae bacterium]
MHLQYDPGDGEAFWAAVRRIPGFPAGEEIPLRRMLFESGALLRLPAVLAEAGTSPGSPAIVVMDPTPMRRGAGELKPLVLALLRQGGRPVEPLVLAPDETGGVHTTMPQIAAVQSRLRPGVAVVGLGSGSVADIAKHACHRFEQDTGAHIPLVLVQTANSVSAFTSNMAPVFVDGVKRTLPSRYPDALVCDLETLRDAPYAMTAAGVGDLLAAFVSLPDWYLAHRLGMDPSYTPLPQTLMGPLDEIFLTAADAIRTRSLEGMALLARLIALGGLAMSLSHATTPMSGFEHVVSHILDLLAELRGRPLAMHGAQVALATLLGAETYRRFLEEFDPARVDVAACFPDVEVMRREVERTFLAVDPTGRAGAECWADYRVKLEAWHARREVLAALLRDWPEVREELQRLARPPERIRAIMRAVAAPLTFAELDPPVSEEDVRFAYLSAPLMRRRFTIGDLLLFLGWDRTAIWRTWKNDPPS